MKKKSIIIIAIIELLIIIGIIGFIWFKKKAEDNKPEEVNNITNDMSGMLENYLEQYSGIINNNLTATPIPVPTWSLEELEKAYNEKYNNTGNSDTSSLDEVVTGEVITDTPAPTPIPEGVKYTFTEESNLVERINSFNEIDLFDGPSIESNHIKTLEKGTLVIIKSTCNETGWLLVDYWGYDDTEYNKGYIQANSRASLFTFEEAQEQAKKNAAQLILEYEQRTGQKHPNRDLYADYLPSTATPTPEVTQAPNATATPKPTQKPAQPTKAPSEKYNAVEPSKPLSAKAEKKRQSIINNLATDTDYPENKKVINYIVDYTASGNPILPGGYMLSDNGYGVLNSEGVFVIGTHAVTGFTDDGKLIIHGEVHEPSHIEHAPTSGEHTGTSQGVIIK